jgi:hypothetical protein
VPSTAVTVDKDWGNLTAAMKLKLLSLKNSVSCRSLKSVRILPDFVDYKEQGYDQRRNGD